MIAFNRNINTISIELDMAFDLEIMWVKVTCKGHKDIIFRGIDRPHVTDSTTIPDLKEWLTILFQRKRRLGLILAGDLNFPGWDWKTITLKVKAEYP